VATLDDFSRLLVVVPVPSKAEVIPTVKKIINMLETQSGQKLCKVRTDRGGEYLNNELKDFYSAKGIVHQTPAPFTPEQNGKAERLNRTLMERVRAMLQDAKLPNSLWAEVVTTAIFICNRSPVCGDFKTPKELFYGDKIDVSNMKTFGARAYFHIPKAQRQKLDPVSIKGIMVGYAADSKAYRIMLDDTKKTIISRDVTFEESIGVPKDEEFQDPEDNSEDNNDDMHETKHQEDAEAEGAAPAPVPAAEPERRYPLRERRSPGDWFKAALSTEELKEPTTYNEAVSGPDANIWEKAMDEEMTSLHSTTMRPSCQVGVQYQEGRRWQHQEIQGATGRQRLQAAIGRGLQRGLRTNEQAYNAEGFACNGGSGGHGAASTGR